MTAKVVIDGAIARAIGAFCAAHNSCDYCPFYYSEYSRCELETPSLWAFGSHDVVHCCDCFYGRPSTVPTNDGTRRIAYDCELSHHRFPPNHYCSDGQLHRKPRPTEGGDGGGGAG